MLVQNNRGDPQKAAPCGGTSEDRGTPSNAITEARGGDFAGFLLRHQRIGTLTCSRRTFPVTLSVVPADD